MRDIATEVAEETANYMVNNISYKETYKTPIEVTEDAAKIKVRNDNEKYTYYEFGTGIVGSRNPHVPDALKRSGWKYDVNAHGELGWWYPTTENDKNNTKKQLEDGTWVAWTKGMVAHKEFYLAGEDAKRQMKEFVTRAIKKYMR